MCHIFPTLWLFPKMWYMLDIPHVGQWHINSGIQNIVWQMLNWKNIICSFVKVVPDSEKIILLHVCISLKVWSKVQCKINGIIWYFSFLFHLYFDVTFFYECASLFPVVRRWLWRQVLVPEAIQQCRHYITSLLSSLP